ncbi:hypothetical protein BV22DRAFT_1027647 [Leucogyrophana mollusca]|uniref:Uncharacterized protein n=1 Tax=Leucogyrophana mollusca TaxID=85980 RepID=A0ACB8C0X0_9AGAM|nr:hypothetical protein BV22DRAFT_1027647 [Leucogyrophana mollusca]
MNVVASSVSPSPETHMVQGVEILSKHPGVKSSASQAWALDLPSWTSLDVQSGSEEDEGIVDGLLSFEEPKMILKPTVGPQSRTSAKAPASTATPQSDSARDLCTAAPDQTGPSIAPNRSSREQKLVFDGVVITSRPPTFNSPTLRSVPRSAAHDGNTSVANALQRTFDANGTSSGESGDALTNALPESFSRRKRPASPVSHYPLPKRRKTRQPSTSSVDGTPPAEDVVRVEAKRRNAARQKEVVIAYDTAREIVDAALETRVATMSWLETKDQWYAWEAQGTKQHEHLKEGLVLHFGDSEGNTQTTPTPLDRLAPKDSIPEVVSQPVLPGKLARMCARDGFTTPRKPTAEMFDERLEVFFGRKAPSSESLRPSQIRSAGISIINHDEPVIQIAPSASPSSTSESTSNAGAEDSTEATSESPEGHPVDEDTVTEWTTALQRLVKGKTKADEESLDHLSVVLGEIESVQRDISKDMLSITGLRETIEQLSVLDEIPFGDVYKLRERSHKIARIWSTV